MIYADSIFTIVLVEFDSKVLGDWSFDFHIMPMPALRELVTSDLVKYLIVDHELTFQDVTPGITIGGLDAKACEHNGSRLDRNVDLHHFMLLTC